MFDQMGGHNYSLTELHFRSRGVYRQGCVEKVIGNERVEDRGKPWVALLRVGNDTNRPQFSHVQPLQKAGAHAQEGGQDSREVAFLDVKVQPPHSGFK